MAPSSTKRRIPVKGADGEPQPAPEPEPVMPEPPAAEPPAEPPAPEPPPPAPPPAPEPEPAAEAIDWRDMALRLQAEMENYRKRLERRAEDRIADEKSRLLQGFLGVVDNLEQGLAHLRPEDPLHQGVRVTFDGMAALLRREGVEPLEAVGQPFDPAWQEAVAMIPAPPNQEPELLVIAQEQRGYKLGERLLRPARVVVAKKG